MPSRNCEPSGKTRAEQERREAARADFDELVRKPLQTRYRTVQRQGDATFEADAGKSLAELKAAAVEAKRRRVQYEKVAVDEVPALLAEQEALAIKSVDASERYQAKLAKLATEHAAVVDPLTGRLSEIQLTLQQAKEWREELRRTYKGPARQALAAIRERQRLANNEGAGIRESLISLRGAIAARCNLQPRTCQGLSQRPGVAGNGPPSIGQNPRVRSGNRSLGESTGRDCPGVCQV